MLKWLKKGVAPSADGQDTARGKDWLVALSPLLLMMVVNYRWPAVWAVLTAAAGYLAVTVGWHQLGLMPRRVVPALVCGVLVAACLPAGAPFWVAATAGLFAAVVAVVPALVNRLAKRDVLSCPVFFPALSGYLLVRWLFPAHFVVYTLPLMWERVDTVAAATPLAGLANPDVAVSLPQLFWGFEAGSMGNGPAVAALFGLAYLVLCRRVQVLSPVAMGGVVFLLSWMCWGAPTYALLAGGTLLAVVLVGDEGFVHVGWKGRLVAGATAGAVTVWLRQRYGVDGSALGLLLAGALTPVLHVSYHGLCRFIRFLREKFAKSEN